MRCQLSEAELAELERWVVRHRADDLESVEVDGLLVAVQGRRGDFVAVGSALRAGDLRGELTTAFANWRRLMSGK